METEFQTDDIQLAAFLLTKGVKLLSTSEESQNHFVFVLADPSVCQKLKIDYLNNEVAPARQLFFQREALINEIKNYKSGLNIG